MPQNPSCTGCLLHKASRTVCAWGDGDPDADIMLVGEALGEMEEITGKPFQGAAGDRLNLALSQAGLRRQDVYISNVVKCRPPGNRNPTQDEVEACRGYLMEEIATVRPKVIVAIGAQALKALTGKEKIGTNRGHLLAPSARIRLGTAKLLATYHPAAFLHRRDPKLEENLVQDLALARKLANPTAQGSASRVLLYGDYTPSQLTHALGTIEDAKVWSCDLEWTGDPKEEVMYWPWRPGGQAYTIALTARTGDGLLHSVGLSLPLPPGCREVLQLYLDAHPVFGHNMQADLLWLKQLGIRVRLAGDTMLIAFLLDENRPLNLEALASTLTDSGVGWKHPPRKYRPVTPAEWEELLGHNIGDTESTLLLMDALLAELKKRPALEQERLKRLYQNLLLPIVPVFTDIAWHGVPMDDEAVEAGYIESIGKAHAHGQALAEQVAPFGVNLTPEQAIDVVMSTKVHAPLLLRRVGIDVVSSSRGALEHYLDHPVVKLYKQIRWERSKVQGTYLGKWRMLLSRQMDHRLHTLYRITGARTGRTSAEVEEGGSIQVAPREKYIRRTVKARKGRVIVAADYSQLELRIVAWLACERRMIEIYKHGGDIHTTTPAFMMASHRDGLNATQFWERQLEYTPLITGDDRQNGKGTNFGYAYGMGAEHFISYAKLQYGLTFDLQRATDFRNGYFELYQDLKPWHAKCVSDYERDGCVITPFGRYRRNIEDVTKMINTPVQAAASDICLLAMIEIYHAVLALGLPAIMIGNVHDSIMVECDLEVQYEVADLMVEKMERPRTELLGLDFGVIPVPLIADIKIGESWADGKEYRKISTGTA